MKFRVCLGVKSTFTAIALRKSLGESPSLRLLGEERDCAGIERLLREQNDCVALIDIELLLDAGGAQLERFLQLRREPTLILSPKGLPIPPALATKNGLRLLSGRRPGEMDLAHIQAELPNAVRTLREAWLQGAALPPPDASSPSLPQRTAPEARSESLPPPPKVLPVELVVIGVSTGGPTLLLQMLKSLVPPTLPFLIAQHMPFGETIEFARRLSEECRIPVREVGRGPLPEIGVVGLVQGGRDFEIIKNGPGSFRLREVSLPDNPFHPSIDHLLATAASSGIATHSVILTGMGQDGSKGAHALMLQGYPVVAQRPDTCAVAGMPSAAINNGAAREIQTPQQIVNTLNRWFTQSPRTTFTGTTPA